MKKFFLIIVIVLVFAVPIGCNSATQANAATNDSITYQEIDDEVLKQLDGLNLDSLDEILNKLTSGQISIFGGNTFYEKLMKLIKGDFDNGKGLWSSILNIFFDDLVGLIPFISLIIAISLLGTMLQGLKSSSNEKSVSSLINFVTYGVIVVMVLTIVAKMITVTTNTIYSIKSQMEIIFPILLTFLSAIGGTVSASIYQPAMALLTSTIISLFTYILLPIFIFSVVFSIVSNLSNSIKLDKFTSFFESTFKWLTGLIFTIFTAFLSVQGLQAGSIDGISMRTVKYAIRSYVPMLGSYISDGMGIVLASSNLIKNAIGATGLYLLLATIISPVIQLVLFMLALRLTAGIIEPLGNKQIANFISSLSKSIVLLLVIVIGIAFVYFILLGLVICSANII